MTTIVTYNPFPAETKSLNALPKDCPIHYLDYGLLTIIEGLVKGLRQEKRDERLDYLIKKTRGPVLKKCLYTLNELSKRFPEHSVINLYKKKSLLTNKKDFKKIILDQNIPLSYIEEAYHLSNKKNTFQKGDWLKIDGRTQFLHNQIGGVYYGICESARPSSSHVLVSIVKLGKTYNEETGKNESYPIWHRYHRELYTRRVMYKSCDVTRITKVGEDNKVWDALRVKRINDFNLEFQKRDDIWTNRIHPILVESGIDEDDPTFISECDKIWHIHHTNLLDKNVWISFKEVVNPESAYNKLYMYGFPIYDVCGWFIFSKIEHIMYLKDLILTNNILE